MARDYFAIVHRDLPMSENLIAAYERGAKDRLRDALRLPDTSEGLAIALMPRDQRAAYADGWLDAFKAERASSAVKGVSL